MPDPTNVNQNGEANQAQNTTGQNSNANNSNNNAGGANVNNPAIDYNKIQAIIDGRNAKTEDSVLKDYFAKQDLSANEIQEAIAAYKNSKAQEQIAKANEVQNLQNQVQALQSQITKNNLNQLATDCALELGIDAKKISPILRMVDMSKIDLNSDKAKELMTNAINEVLEVLPELKPQTAENKGFQKIGADNSNNNGTSTDDMLKAIFGG